ncbi:SepM family pheromone-processing serine protease [Pseudalkalibacillus berkeleyi]|uniref:endopeptidase La n=1 Tax=Pseudalkalibacillus berkeleyi TaxID=1069813 RepID=A0ABS9GVZ9_9BACL|nr:SepM family pheromone-processing serine protease [Pseudalkalibacillus berkeleyi]MCF6136992.1 PDZ domain-containing protein [Pseudalkalibacillus berkeleyi]
MKRLRTQWPWAVLLLVILIAFLPIPYYFTQPGDAKVLSPIIKVEEGNKSEGSFMLTTVLIGKANAAEYLWAQVSDYREVIPEDHVRGSDETEEEYQSRQLQLMQSSQHAATIVAYKEANKGIEITNKGVLITGVISGMPAADLLKIGDLITELNGSQIKTAEQLVDQLKKFKANDEVELTVSRDSKEKKVTIALKPFPEKVVNKDGEERAGIGITYPVTFTEIETNPEIKIETNQIGGPSAGLMFTLEIYNQLTKTDWTKGRQIAGTGTMNEAGEVGPIGGIKQKVVAADNADAVVFFAPVAADNYKHAKEAAEDINTDMEIVPVKTFTDALEYLKKEKN